MNVWYWYELYISFCNFKKKEDSKYLLQAATATLQPCCHTGLAGSGILVVPFKSRLGRVYAHATFWTSCWRPDVHPLAHPANIAVAPCLRGVAFIRLD